MRQTPTLHCVCIVCCAYLIVSKSCIAVGIFLKGDSHVMISQALYFTEFFGEGYIAEGGHTPNVFDGLCRFLLVVALGLSTIGLILAGK